MCTLCAMHAQFCAGAHAHLHLCPSLSVHGARDPQTWTMVQTEMGHGAVRFGPKGADNGADAWQQHAIY
eukprot:1429054-Lingulodinium_polyedra.AAC.1